MLRMKRTQLATAAGVSRKTITVQCYPGGKLEPAVAGRFLDADHPSVAAFLKSKGANPTKVFAELRKTAAAAPKRTRKAGKQREGYAHLSLADLQTIPIEELLHRFGDLQMLKDWLDAGKKHADTREKELKNAQAQGKVIDRELVRHHVFGAIEASNQRLLGDVPKTISRRLFALAKSDGTLEEAEALIREVISSQLKPVSKNARKALGK